MRLALVVEARADAEDAQILADRVMVACGPDWMDADSIGHLRTWTGIPPDEPFTRWETKQVEALPGRMSGSFRCMTMNVEGKWMRLEVVLE